MCLYVDCEKVSEKWRRCGSRMNDDNSKHDSSNEQTNERMLTPQTHTHPSTTKAIIITKIRKGTHFYKLFITFEYYLSMVGSCSVSTDHVLIFVLSLFSTFSLFTWNHEPLFALPRTHSHARILLQFFFSFVYSLFTSLSVLIFHFNLKLVVRSSYPFLLSHLYEIFLFSSPVFIILFLIMVSFFKQLDKLSMMCSNAQCVSGWIQVIVLCTLHIPINIIQSQYRKT